MGRCVICNCEVSNNPFRTKDKFELRNHSVICKTCAHKIGITSIWDAATYTAQKAIDKYYRWYPKQMHTGIKTDDNGNGKEPQLFRQEGRLDAGESTLSVRRESDEIKTTRVKEEVVEVTAANVSSKCTEKGSGDEESTEGAREIEKKLTDTMDVLAERTENVLSDVESKSDIPSPTEKQRTYSFPPLSLLNQQPNASYPGSTDFMRESSRRINEILLDSHVDAHIIQVISGPISVRYEVELDRGVRLAEIKCLSSDIALALGCENVTISPVVGKCSVVGIDVPRKSVGMVCLRDAVDSRELLGTKSKIAFALGKDVVGNNIVCDINKERHLLIAGTTGSGKSTLLHSMIVSMLYRATPDDIRFVMVDTKGLELTPYNGIPQMLIPVITDERKAVGALQWLNTELRRRYKTISDAGVTSVDVFNHLMAGAGETLPHIVAIIDDVFHLFSPKDDSIEEVLRNLILRGHAVGIHLVLATQHAYTGAIVKIANLRNMGRIAFALSGRCDSIALLGKDGAEKLSGKGEMLYLPNGSSVTQHIQGCFITSSEIGAVADFVRENYAPNYDQTVIDDIPKATTQTSKKSSTSESNATELDGDEMLPAAVAVVLETGQASVSMLQRRLKLGFARAARIVDEMEEKGIVGPFQGSKPRAILITKEQWEKTREPGEIIWDDELQEMLHNVLTFR